MNSSSVSRIEMLSKDNYDTWKIQMEALLTKNDEWCYANGSNQKPALVQGNAESEKVVKEWIQMDGKAKADIILSICPSELKQIKGCTTSHEVWQKLESTYQSKGPARKATLLKQLTLHRMEENGNVRDHINKFFDAVDKLGEMDVDINPDLLSIMLLYSLPSSFENFRCAIESRDDLPSPESLRIKIVEEDDARRSDIRNMGQNAMMSNRKYYNRNPKKEVMEGKTGVNNSDKKGKFKFRCHKCKGIGHKAVDCRSKDSRQRSANFSLNLCHQSAYHTNEFCETSSWCLDSGATSHFSKDIQNFSTIINSNKSRLNLANNSTTEIVATGTVSLSVDIFGEKKELPVNDVMYVPDLRTNLLSVGKITDKGCEVIFNKNNAFIVDSEGEIKLAAERIGDLYYVRERNRNKNFVHMSVTSSENFLLWHRRLGHLNVTDMIKAKRNGTVKGLDIQKSEGKLECDICCKGKMTQTPFPKHSERKTELLEIIHSDICGPMRVESNNKARYVMTLIDDSSRWCEVRFLKSKNEALENFKNFVTLIENQKGKRVKFLQSDNGGEYLSNEFDRYLTAHGISRRLTVPHTPEQNGVSERKNRTLFDTARCLLIQSGLPLSFWAEAVNTANYIRNRCPTKTLNGMTPYEAWTKKKPSVSHFRDFGSRVFCLNKAPNKGKLLSRCNEGILVGYSEYSKGYRVWLKEERRVDIVRDVKFMERINNNNLDETENFLPNELTEEKNEKIPRIVEIENKSTEPNILHESEDNQQRNTEEPIEVIAIEQNIEETNIEGNMEERNIEENVEEVNNEERNAEVSGRGPGRPKLLRTGCRGRPRKIYQEANEVDNFNKERECEEFDYAFLADIPLKQALNSPEAEEWYNAMTAEIKSIISNNTWELVQRPANCEVIGCRMILRNKFKSDGTLERRKARLVAQGFSQQPGVHYKQTFAPVARLSSIRLMVSLATHLNMSIQQFDVETAYLNGELEEEIYMEPPKHFESILNRIINQEKTSPLSKKCMDMLKILQEGDKVCLLKRSLYGLKQAGRAWNKKLDLALKKIGAKPTNADPCIYYIGKGKNTDAAIIGIWVDDILVATRSLSVLQAINDGLSAEFKIKDLGRAAYCLGIQFKHEQNKFSLSQKGYILDLLTKFGMSDCKPISTPLDPNIKLYIAKNVSKEDAQLPYRELVGSLTYLAVATRPDICHAVNYLSQYNNCYDSSHWTAAKRILRYLKHTQNTGLVYQKDNKSLMGYVDADWASCPNDRRSYTGFVFMLNGGPISWESKKQRTVALSSTEAEYMAMAEASKEAIHLRRFLKELELEDLAHVVLHNDNNGALKLARNPVYHARSKHIDIRHHFVREALEKKEFTLKYLPTQDMVADILTKSLTRIKHEKLSNLMKLSTIDDTGPTIN